MIYFSSSFNAADGSKKVLSSGGRVLAVTAVGENLSAALAHAYEALKHVHFAGMQ